MSVKRFLRYAKPLFVLAVLAAVAWVLHDMLREYRYQQVFHALRQIPTVQLVAGVLVSLAGYFVMTGYDTLAFYYIRKPLSYSRIALASFIGYAFSNNFGLSGIIGGSIRFRFYTAWRLSGVDVVKVITFCTLTFWVGFLLLSGSFFLIAPPPLPPQVHVPFASLRILAFLFIAPVALYLASGIALRRPIRIGAWRFTFPAFPVLVTQVVLSLADWLIAITAFYILLPHMRGFGFAGVAAVFLLAQLGGIISTLPGGLGVFETVVILFLAPHAAVTSILASLLAFRFVYYFVPLVLATLLLAVHEGVERREGVARVAQIFGRWAPGIVPQALTLTTFVAGAVLLFSGATPTVGVRLRWLRELVPLPIVELSHLLGSVTGAALLLLSRGLQRRLDAAYVLTIAMLTAGIVFSLVKGIDYEEAIVLSITLAAFIPSRRHFYRKTSLLGEPFTGGWITAIAVVLFCSVWLGFFSYKHVDYSTELWWDFSFRGEAPRFLRAAVASTAVVLIFALARLLRPATPEPELPSEEEIERAHGIIANSETTLANLALLGDKELLFSTSGNGFLMYAVEGRSWIAMGDPIGSDREKQELVWAFRELSDRHSGWTVFYEVARTNLHLYLDLGLTLVKMGEEASIPLDGFSLEGGSRKWLRKMQRRVEAEGCSFEMLPPERVRDVLPQLRAISDEWLVDKRTREKGFSLGFFSEEYVARYPVAVVRRGAEPVAFANVWTTASKEELSVDLMRHLPGAPNGVMDYLFLNIILWGQSERYRSFNLGMAPLSGLENRALGPFWHRAGALAYRHAENFYNFQGLRQYKEKFDPVWQPTYLAYPGGLALPIILTNLASLIAGGFRGVFAK